jgi:hypothetical protein
MIYVDSSGAISPIEKEGFYPVHEGTKPTLQPCTTAVPDRLQWHEDGHWVQLWKLQPLPLYSAGEWLELVGLGASQQPTLIYLRMKLEAANKVSNKLDSLEAYLQSILSEYAIDNSPKCDWGQPPVSYHDTVKEVMQILSS